MPSCSEMLPIRSARRPGCSATRPTTRPFGMNMTTGLDWWRGLILSTGGRRCWTSV
uniref:Alternative protein TEKT2 n=1 Tax=Homo sapiens TaxID=9606 RepID=L8E8I2_HUMAN|nr:alternative protein TEKT2 [Homo sapiens]